MNHGSHARWCGVFVTAPRGLISGLRANERDQGSTAWVPLFWCKATLVVDGAIPSHWFLEVHLNPRALRTVRPAPSTLPHLPLPWKTQKGSCLGVGSDGTIRAAPFTCRRERAAQSPFRVFSGSPATTASRPTGRNRSWTRRALSCWMPTARAVRTDPVVALRTE
jgi:hypothetical protein